MRYNRDTERGILIDEIATQCANAVKLAAGIDFPCSAAEPILQRVWDCRRGGWILETHCPVH